MGNLKRRSKEEIRKRSKAFENGTTFLALFFGVLLLASGIIILYNGKVTLGFSSRFNLPTIQSGHLRIVFGIVALLVGGYRWKNSKKIIEESIKNDNGL